MLSSSIRHIPAIFTRKNQKSHHMMKKPAKGGVTREKVKTGQNFKNPI